MAVYPCMHIVGVRPMYSSESLTQVVLFVRHVLSYLRGVTCVVYDFACGVLRHLLAQMRKRQGTPAHASWEKLLSLKWIVDKLHFGRGHTACKNESSTYYEPSVNPYSHDEIVGVDTEGAEQIFHVASRWQTNLSNMPRISICNSSYSATNITNDTGATWRPKRISISSQLAGRGGEWLHLRLPLVRCTSLAHRHRTRNGGSRYPPDAVMPMPFHQKIWKKESFWRRRPAQARRPRPVQAMQEVFSEMV